MIYDCITIGAGAAGLFFGATTPEKINGLILEKTKRPGTKLLMSGSGQCNITHSGSIKDFVPHYGKNGGRIRGALFKYNNNELCDFLKNNGIPLFYREDGKVFPKSMKAEDILNMLLKKTKENGYEIKYECELTGIEEENGHIKVTAGNGTFLTRNLVLATGGMSYPTTGSDGSIFPVLKKYLGIKLTDFHPALSPVSVQDYPYSSLSGISFKGINVSLYRNNKKVSENTDDMLFTHKDLSGPVILNMSKEIFKGDEIKINYVYPENRQDIVKRITEATEKSKSEWRNILPSALSLPKSFIEEVLKETGNKPKAIAAKLTEDTFTISKVADFKTAMATSGGISLSEIDLKTMQLKKHEHIYAIGEMTDIDGHTGGYNLQFCYSSARTAGESISF